MATGDGSLGIMPADKSIKQPQTSAAALREQVTHATADASRRNAGTAGLFHQISVEV